MKKPVLLIFMLIMIWVLAGCNSGTGSNYSSIGGYQGVLRQQYAYLTNPLDDANGTMVSKCVVEESTGYLNDCEYVNTVNNYGASSTAFNESYAYVTSFSTSEITQCTVTESGYFGNCVENNASSVNSASDIAFNADAAGHTFMYITNSFQPGSMTKCAVNNTNGKFSVCEEITNENFYYPNSVSFYKSPIESNDATYAYITNFNNLIVKYKVDDFGNLTQSSIIDSSVAPINNPTSVVFSKSYAYITNSKYDGRNISNSNPNTIAKCKVDPESGNFSACILEKAVDGLLDHPDMMAIDKFGKYAYIINFDSSEVLLCKIDVNGDLNGCENSNFNMPTIPNSITLQ